MSPQLASTGCRQAALSLHAMHPEDRAWVLEALPVEHSAVLASLLDELRALGIPEAAAIVQGDPAPPKRKSAGAVLQDIDHAGIRALVRLLDGEPARVVATLLQADSWPWRDRLLAALPAERSHEIARLANADIIAPAAVRAAVLSAVLERWSQVPAMPSSATRWQRWARFVLQRGKP